ncbi:hypothetical protein IWX49DRAFT_582654 [Phyllosticta citricarpa]
MLQPPRSISRRERRIWHGVWIGGNVLPYYTLCVCFYGIDLGLRCLLWLRLAFWRVAVFLCSSPSVSLNSVGGLSSQRMLDVGFLLHHATPFDMLTAQTDAHQSCRLTARILRKQKRYLASYSDTSAHPLRHIVVPSRPTAILNHQNSKKMFSQSCWNN